MSNDRQYVSPSFVESIAGFAAGVASTLKIAHPLDIIKTRLQIDRASSLHIGLSFRVVRDIARNEGGLKAFYRGLTPNLVGNSVSWALYFVWYTRIKLGVQAVRGSETSLTYYDFFLASGAAGGLTAACTNPIWVIKTRMLSTSATHPGAYTSIVDGTRQILRSEGIRGFYHGLLPSLFGVSHGALQFMAYEQLKIYQARGMGAGQKGLRVTDYLLLSGIAKVFAGSITYPYQVVRARLQMYDARERYKNASDVIGQVWKKEGFAGFYKGLGPNLLRVMPSTWVTFLVYEETRLYLPEMLSQTGDKQ